MKFNNKLSLVDYLQVVNEIANEFFDMNSYEYTPQIGEIYAVCAYFNYCVELEDTDEIKVHPITDIMDMQQLFDNEEFMEKYNAAVIDNNAITKFSLTFGNAYHQANAIVNYKKNDANSFAIAISSSMNAILNSFRESFSDEEITNFTNIADQIVQGKLSSDAIVEAYGNSSRFKDNTNELNSLSESNIIPFSQDK